jgi:hypothetical protein
LINARRTDACSTSKARLVENHCGSVADFIEVKNHVHSAANLLKASNEGEQLGMNIAMAALIVIGCWLPFTGIAPIFRKMR